MADIENVIREIVAEYFQTINHTHLCMEAIDAVIDHPAIREHILQSAWQEHGDIPNIDAMSVNHKDIGKPLVTRDKTGQWYVHPALPPLPPTGGDDNG